MATLTDAFLADLDELSDGEDVPFDDDKEAMEAEEQAPASLFGDLGALATARDAAAVCTLTSTPKYQATLAAVDAEVARHGDAMPDSWAGPSEADPVYLLIVACNELMMAIDDEIAKVHAYIKELYRKRFPELEGLVLDPVAYARVVERIGNEENVIAIDLEDVIPRHVQMTVSVSASTTDGRALAPADLARVIDACAMMGRLDADRAKLLQFVSHRMALVAPNLSQVCGAEVAARLVGAAGGLHKLSEIPSCNILVLGQKRRINAGLSSANIGANQGHVFGCPLVASVPPDYRTKTARHVANKVALLARYDAFGTGASRSGEQGAKMAAEMRKAVDKWMEPPPAALAKPLPAPDATARKRRGGKRYRKAKDRLAATEMMTQANRMQFGKAEEEYIDGDEMFGLGMLGGDGHGKLKIMQAASRITKKEKAGVRKAGGGRGGPGGAVSGLASSLAFSHVQGIELENPNREEAAQADVGGSRASGTESYFSERSGFKTFRKV